MSGQPKEFDVLLVVPTETAGGQAPAFVVEEGNSITLKTYFHTDASADPITRDYVKGKITTNGIVEYHLQNLETGDMVPSIPGISPPIFLDGTSIPTLADVLGPGGDLEGYPATGHYFLSAETNPITTGPFGSGKDLERPDVAGDPDHPGTWRVLTHVHGAAGDLFSAFDDNFLIQVIAMP